MGYQDITGLEIDKAIDIIIATIKDLDDRANKLSKGSRDSEL